MNPWLWHDITKQAFDQRRARQQTIDATSATEYEALCSGRADGSATMHSGKRGVNGGRFREPIVPAAPGSHVVFDVGRWMVMLRRNLNVSH